MRGLVIISGGQTGADRVALDWAIRHHVPHAGWCPNGRLAEDGPLPRCYQLHETETSDYAERTGPVIDAKPIPGWNNLEATSGVD
jgi:hypothetical protein